MKVNMRISPLDFLMDKVKTGKTVSRDSIMKKIIPSLNYQI